MENQRTSFGQKGKAPNNRPYQQSVTGNTRQPKTTTQKGSNSSKQAGFSIFRSGPADHTPLHEPGRWSMFTAPLKGYLAASLIGMAFMGFGSTVADTGADLGVFQGFADQLHKYFVQFVLAIAFCTAFAPIGAIPVRILHDIVSLSGLRRGLSDIIVGGTIGSLFIVKEMNSGGSIGMFEIGMFLGGFVGGFVYWRARGYPGLGAHELRGVEIAGGLVDRARRSL